jgi:hypothetical protein
VPAQECFLGADGQLAPAHPAVIELAARQLPVRVFLRFKPHPQADQILAPRPVRLLPAVALVGEATHRIAEQRDLALAPLVDDLVVRPAVGQHRQRLADEVEPGVAHVVHVRLHELGALRVAALDSPVDAARKHLDRKEDRPHHRVVVHHFSVGPGRAPALQPLQPLLQYEPAELPQPRRTDLACQIAPGDSSRPVCELPQPRVLPRHQLRGCPLRHVALTRRRRR